MFGLTLVVIGHCVLDTVRINVYVYVQRHPAFDMSVHQECVLQFAIAFVHRQESIVFLYIFQFRGKMHMQLKLQKIARQLQRENCCVLNIT
jgi:hypothetical protein